MKCFRCQGLGHYAYKCPNKKAMILKDGKYISESEVEKGEESEDDEEEVEKTPEGELLMIRRLLGHQLKYMEESQRERGPEGVRVVNVIAVIFVCRIAFQRKNNSNSTISHVWIISLYFSLFFYLSYLSYPLFFYSTFNYLSLFYILD